MKHNPDPLKKRRLLIQAITLLILLGVIAFICYNVQQNLSRAGQELSFKFLNDRAGFPIDQSLIPYEQNDSIARVLLVGLLNTLLLSILVILSATLFGILLSALRLSKNLLIQKLSICYIDLFRNIPLLLQIFFWYFAILSLLPMPRATTLTLDCDATQSCALVLSNRGLSLPKPHWDSHLQQSLILLAIAITLSLICHIWRKRHKKQTGDYPKYSHTISPILLILPILFYILNLNTSHAEFPQLQGFNYRGGITILPEFIALWLSLTLYSTAYIAEYIRAGIESVAKGQREAAESLALSEKQIMRLIILPQALRVALPPLSNQYLNIIKNSSLAAAIAYPDLVSVFTGTALNQTGRAIEIISITMAIYLSISLLISLIINRLKKHEI